ncbi:serine/threonine-protein kinase -related [Anaeramoeba flamelloides]|uniref:Serine/threonine-protein kinase -related n=1 Tax=Anaeramoeba flamelloides TaxID=1746091 RepID=A0ABQ8YDJ6_9EUKA|nr:serine/threonine-protein kinase -related [Anaeramoeba flamelloides]
MSINHGWELYCAAEKGIIEKVKEELQNGADINYQHIWWREKNLQEGWGPPTPLIVASRKGHFRVVKYLIENGADKTLKNNSGETAQDLALKGGHLLIYRYLKGEKIVTARIKNLTSKSVQAEFQLFVQQKFRVSLIDKEEKKVFALKHLKSNETLTFEKLEPKTKYQIRISELSLTLLEFETIPQCSFEMKKITYNSSKIQILWDYYSPKNTKITTKLLDPQKEKQDQKTHIIQDKLIKKNKEHKNEREEENEKEQKIEKKDENEKEQKNEKEEENKKKREKIQKLKAQKQPTIKEKKEGPILKFSNLISNNNYQLQIEVQDEKYGLNMNKIIEFKTKQINLDVFQLFLRKSLEFEKIKQFLLIQQNYKYIENKIKKINSLKDNNKIKLDKIETKIRSADENNIKWIKTVEELQNTDKNEEIIINECKKWFEKCKGIDLILDELILLIKPSNDFQIRKLNQSLRRSKNKKILKNINKSDNSDTDIISDEEWIEIMQEGDLDEGKKVKNGSEKTKGKEKKFIETKKKINLKLQVLNLAKNEFNKSLSHFLSCFKGEKKIMKIESLIDLFNSFSKNLSELNSLIKLDFEKITNLKEKILKIQSKNQKKKTLIASILKKNEKLRELTLLYNSITEKYKVPNLNPILKLLKLDEEFKTFLQEINDNWINLEKLTKNIYKKCLTLKKNNLKEFVERRDNLRKNIIEKYDNHIQEKKQVLNLWKNLNNLIKLEKNEQLNQNDDDDDDGDDDESLSKLTELISHLMDNKQIIINTKKEIEKQIKKIIDSKEENEILIDNYNNNKNKEKISFSKELNDIYKVLQDCMGLEEKKNIIFQNLLKHKQDKIKFYEISFQELNEKIDILKQIKSKKVEIEKQFNLLNITYSEIIEIDNKILDIKLQSNQDNNENEMIEKIFQKKIQKIKNKNKLEEIQLKLKRLCLIDFPEKLFKVFEVLNLHNNFNDLLLIKKIWWLDKEIKMKLIAFNNNFQIIPNNNSSENFGKGLTPCYKCKYLQNNKKDLCVVKSYPRKMINFDSNRLKFFLLKMKHPSIISINSFFIGDNKLYIEMPYYSNGNLSQYLQKTKINDVNKIIKILWLILNALKYLHANNCSFQNLKLSNILIDQDANIKIADFQLLNISTLQNFLNKTSRGELKQALSYLAPELVETRQQSNFYFSPETDMFSFGMLMKDLQKLVPNLSNDKRYQKIIKQLLAKRPEQRPDSKQNLFEEFVPLKEIKKWENLLYNKN